MLEENYKIVIDEMNKALRYIDKPKKKVNLIVVSKTVEMERIMPLIKLGHRDFGENRVGEALEKWAEVKKEYKDLRLHLIGPLQSNKIDEALSIFDVIHTVDRISLAEKLSKKDIENKTFFAQINTGKEEQKSGLFPEDLENFLKECPLKISGLMCIPPVTDEPSVHFHMMNVLKNKHNIENLSMGMSSDFKEAIMLGADYIRVGSKIFGERLSLK